MRGPSSSHTAATWRAARTCLDILNEPLKKAVIDFDKAGAWTTNYREQGTAMGIDGGLLGLEMTDSRMKNTDELAEEMGISIRYEINSFQTTHANTIRLSLEAISGRKAQVVAVSLGGGSFEIKQINEFNVSIYGDYFELLIFYKPNEQILHKLRTILPKNMELIQSSNKNGEMINVKFKKKISKIIINKLKKVAGIDDIIVINPVLPVISGNETEIPFTDIASLIEYADKEKLDLGKIALIYEKCQSGLSKPELLSKMKNIIEIIENSIETGLRGTKYENRILPQQSHLIEKTEKAGKILQNSVINRIVAYVTAIMESKSAMEVIVANPTAGSCGTVGGVLKAISDDLNATKEELTKAYFAAGIVGVYFAAGPGFSAEEHGCQVECGAASGMAAAGIAQLFGGTAKQAIDAASMAIQNMIGLICDPVADRVEVPCLGKNISAAMNALSSATMACSGFDAVIPFEEVIQTISKVSTQMPGCVKCTGEGGLAITKSALNLKGKLATYQTDSS